MFIMVVYKTIYICLETGHISICRTLSEVFRKHLQIYVEFRFNCIYINVHFTIINTHYTIDVWSNRF